MFWAVVARYEIVHLHFMLPMSLSGWELPILRSMGRKIVVHFRGCEIRDPDTNRRLHPGSNICEQCDYGAIACSDEGVRRRRDLATRYGDAFLATTPDLLDFFPAAEHMPFFAPEEAPEPLAEGSPRYPDRPLRIVHVTMHPGIEGTEEIRRAAENLRARGFRLEFVFLKGVPHEQVMRELKDADLSIGKMKMGYYANAQIEAMALGVPTITWVRPEFMTEQLRDTGLIFSDLDRLEETLQYYLANPEALKAKRLIARESILRLHNNDLVAKRYLVLYNRLLGRA
jgi:predicted TIM-barrel fold metal-dependent hydrolase